MGENVEDAKVLRGKGLGRGPTVTRDEIRRFENALDEWIRDVFRTTTGAFDRFIRALKRGGPGGLDAETKRFQTAELDRILGEFDRLVRPAADEIIREVGAASLVFRLGLTEDLQRLFEQLRRMWDVFAESLRAFLLTPDMTEEERRAEEALDDAFDALDDVIREFREAFLEVARQFAPPPPP